MMSDELRAGLYAFELVQKRGAAGRGSGQVAGAAGHQVGVVGAGLMASQMALLFAQRLGVPVMTDLDQGAHRQGLAYAHGEIDKLAAAWARQRG